MRDSNKYKGEESEREREGEREIERERERERERGCKEGETISQDQQLPLVGDFLPVTYAKHITCEYRIEVECAIPWCPDVELHIPVGLYEPPPQLPKRPGRRPGVSLREPDETDCVAWQYNHANPKMSKEDAGTGRLALSFTVLSQQPSPDQYWMLKKDDDKKERPERKKKAPKQQQPRTSTSKEDEGWTTVSGVEKVAKEKPLFEEGTEITVDVVNQKIAELSSIRGRRGANRKKNIETFELLTETCYKENLGIPVVAKCLYYTCLAIFD
eukprot:sb/3468149/